MAATVIAAAGSFAAISTLLGSPLLAAFLLLEASGLGGPMLGVVLVPGLLAAGVGTLIFVGLDSHHRPRDVLALAHRTCRPSTGPRSPCSAGRSSSASWRRSLGLGIRHLARTPPAGGRAAHAGDAAARRHRRRRARGLLRRGHRPPRLRRPVLRPGPAPVAGRPGGRVVRRRAAAARRLQGAGLRAVAQRVPRRPGVPGDVHRRRGRHRRVAPARASRSSPRWRWASARCPPSCSACR